MERYYGMQKKMKNKNAFAIVLLSLGFVTGLCSCSLKYDEIVNAEETNPEFIFNHAKMIRYENGKETARVQADGIEKYKDSDKTYGYNVKFMTYDENHKLETEGSCGYLFADTESEIYELYDGIKLFSNIQNTNFFADMLKWNGKTEQLIGGRRDTVRVEKDGTIIYGTGFSASGVSKKFGFSGTVSGEIETKDKDQDQNQEEPEEETN